MYGSINTKKWKNKRGVVAVALIEKIKFEVWKIICRLSGGIEVYSLDKDKWECFKGDKEIVDYLKRY